MIARLNGIGNLATNNSYQNDSPPLKRGTHVNYYAIRSEEDPFADKTNLDLLDESQEKEITTGIRNILQEAERNGMQQWEQDELRLLITHHKDVFRTALSLGPSAKVKP